MLVERPVPHLNQSRGTTSPSVSGEAISARFLHEWIGFPRQMLTLCNTLSLDVNVPVTDDSDMNEHYHVGNELGLTGRFNKYVCDPVAKVLSVTEHAHLTFGDFQAAVHTQCSDVPDVVVLSVPKLDVIAVGELKPVWTVLLEEYPVNEGPANIVPMQPHFGSMNPTEIHAH